MLNKDSKILKYSILTSLAIILIILATATIIEKFLGSEAVHEEIYGTWWFVAIWAVLTITSLIYIIKEGLYRQKKIFIFHSSLILILLGAFITYLTGDRGYLHIRQGEIANFYTSEENAEKQSLPFSVKLILFDIEYHPGMDEPADYISFLKVDEEVVKVSMNKIYKKAGYRLYQMDYDPDEMGTVLVVSHDPYGIAITYIGYILLGISMMWILFSRIGWKKVLYITIPLIGVWYYISQWNPMTPVLRSPMLAAHVSVIMVSYLLLLFIVILSVVALCSSKNSKKLYSFNSFLLYPALFLLIAGIFIGAVWANISWGRYWGWDAKETWALITMLVYAFPFHKKSIKRFRDPKFFHWFCILAFLSILMTFFGVSYFLGGIHSYI